MKLETHKNDKIVKTPFVQEKTGNKQFIPQKTGLSDVNLTTWRDEIFSFLEEMETLAHEEDEEVFIKLSAWSARASHIRAILILDSSRAYQAFRTGIIDPFIQECDRQFKVLSRILSVRQMQWEMDSKL